MPLQDWIQPYPHVAALLQHEDAVLLDRPEGAAALDVHAACRVVYPRAADNVSRPLPYRLSAVNQPVISPLNQLRIRKIVRPGNAGRKGMRMR
jgi:hypothetical protein